VQWEKSDAKAAVVGYSLLVLFVVYLTESLVHLPLLNVLLGVPLELLGLTSAAALAYKYTQEGGDPIDDLSALTVRGQPRSPLVWSGVSGSDSRACLSASGSAALKEFWRTGCR